MCVVSSPPFSKSAFSFNRDVQKRTAFMRKVIKVLRSANLQGNMNLTSILCFRRCNITIRQLAILSR